MVLSPPPLPNLKLPPFFLQFEKADHQAVSVNYCLTEKIGNRKGGGGWRGGLEMSPVRAGMGHAWQFEFVMERLIPGTSAVVSIGC